MRRVIVATPVLVSPHTPLFHTALDCLAVRVDDCLVTDFQKVWGKRKCRLSRCSESPWYDWRAGIAITDGTDDAVA